MNLADLLKKNIVMVPVVKEILGGQVHLGHGIGMERLLKTLQTLTLLGLKLKTSQQVYFVIQSIGKTLMV